MEEKAHLKSLNIHKLYKGSFTSNATNRNFHYSKQNSKKGPFH